MLARGGAGPGGGNKEWWTLRAGNCGGARDRVTEMERQGKKEGRRENCVDRGDLLQPGVGGAGSEPHPLSLPAL